MRTKRRLLALPLLALFAVGCANVTGGRAGLPNRWRTMASTGGKPAPVEAGPPGKAVTAELDEPDSGPRAEGRISGRVVDERGRAVPNVEVRLADGTSRAGRDLRDTTDESGGFSLRGLRPGGSYTLIAESDDGQTLISGRARAKAPSTGVKIKLASSDAESEAERPEPARRGHVGRVSERESIDEGDEEVMPARANAPRVNNADLPPAEEADEIAPPAASSEPIRKTARTAWRRGTSDPAVEVADTSTEPRTTPKSESRPAEAPAPARPVVEDDGPNPLPPAKERPAEKAPEKVVPAEAVPPTERSPAPSPSPAEPAAPGATPPPASDPFLESTSPQPSATPPPIEAPADGKHADSPAKAPDNPPPNEPPATAPTDPAKPADSVMIPAEAAPRHRPTWRELTEQNANNRPDTAMPISTRRGPSGEAAVATAEPNRPARGIAGLIGGHARRNEAAPADMAVVPASCQYDAKRQRIVDFRLPDLDGRPVRFQDIDADYVLLDFWGTWCKPCRDSIPHLVELQTRYGPKTLRVVGVATEHDGSVEDKARRVDETAKSLGVNYPVLLSEADDTPCPLQQALHIQMYPTMVLLDRTGTILWRGTGAELPTMSRLDRVIAARADAAVVRR